MSSLPLISHHLFVAAVAPEDGRPRRAPRQSECIMEPPPAEPVITLELVEAEPIRQSERRSRKPAMAGVV